MTAQPAPDAALAVKIAPPRALRLIVVRERLIRRFHEVRERALVAVQAPEGFGKTSLLARFRREWLNAGACVAWVGLDASDDEARFVEAVHLGVYAALGRPDAAGDARRRVAGPVGAIEALAALVGEIVEQARTVLLVFDDVHKPGERVSGDLLSYLTFNLPPNAHLVVGSRRALPFSTSDLIAHGQCAVFGASDLAFRLEETRDLFRLRLGDRVDLDTVARVHDLVEGWPMGLQLAIAAVERDPHPAEALRRLAGPASDLQTHLAEVILPRLPPDVLRFLVAVAPLERLHPDLCAAVTGRNDAPAMLDRLQSETPLLHAAEGSPWVSLHAIFRGMLASRFEALPRSEREAMHWRAAQWLHGRGMDEEAARHALAAGREATACEWIAEALHDLVLSSGRVATARAWLDRLPADVVSRNDRARLAAAWTYHLSSQPHETVRVIEPLLASGVDPAVRYEALLARAGAELFMDDIAGAAEAIAALEPMPVSPLPFWPIVLGNLRAAVRLAKGDTAGARRVLADAGAGDEADLRAAPQYGARYFFGSSFLLDARPADAARALDPALARAELEIGRRSAPACLLAAALAAGQWDEDRRDAAEATLADRLDVIERTGFPPAVVLAYLTLARAAFERRDLGRAQDLLDSLDTLGEARHQPRLVIASLAEQVRVHSLLGHADACDRTLDRLRDARGRWRGAERGIGDLLDTACGLAEIRGALCARRPEARERIETLRAAGLPLAERDRLELNVLDWAAARIDGASRDELLAEAARTAAAHGWRRLLTDCHPAAAEAAQRFDAGLPHVPAPPRDASTAPPSRGTAAHRASGLLTAKESEVLGLLAHNYSNKEIARILDVGAETVKSHLRNLYSKLDAAGRRHAVERARLLQLID